MVKYKSIKTAREIIDQFFIDLVDLKGMDQNAALILLTLWNEGKLGRDELLTELENARAREGNDGSKET